MHLVYLNTGSLFLSPRLSLADKVPPSPPHHSFTSALHFHAKKAERWKLRSWDTLLRTYHQEFTKIYLVMLIIKGLFSSFFLENASKVWKLKWPWHCWSLRLSLSTSWTPVQWETQLTRQSCPAPIQQVSDAQSILRSSPMFPWKPQMRHITFSKRVNPAYTTDTNPETSLWSRLSPPRANTAQLPRK